MYLLSVIQFCLNLILLWLTTAATSRLFHTFNTQTNFCSLALDRQKRATVIIVRHIFIRMCIVTTVPMYILLYTVIVCDVTYKKLSTKPAHLTTVITFAEDNS